MPLNNVPNPGQTLNNSRAPINQNFASINTAFSVDHQTFQTARQGVHNQVTLPQLGATPATTGVGTDLRLFTALFAGSGQSELFLQRMSNPGSPLPITVAVGPNGLGVLGYMYLANGTLIKYGIDQCSGGEKIVDTTALGLGPAYTNQPFFALAIPSSAPGSGTVGTMSVRQYDILSVTFRSTASNTTFIWMTMGRGA